MVCKIQTFYWVQLLLFTFFFEIIITFYLVLSITVKNYKLINKNRKKEREEGSLLHV